MTTSGTKEWAEFNVNFSKGCSNDCKYCYAKRMAKRFGWKLSWDAMENKEEMAEKGFTKREGVIMSPSSHDITESNIDLGITVFEHILEVGNNLLIVSKPKASLIKKICEALDSWKDKVLFRFTIGTLDDTVRAQWEPGAPTIKERIEALEYAFSNDWKTSVSIEPYLDRQVVPLIKKLEPFVTDTLWVGPMNKIHVPKEYWTEKETKLYSVETRKELKKEILALNVSKIKFKDHFLHKL